MAKIFVHIGLPKTATTTLQKQVFTKISNQSLNYLGVFQPRDVKQNNLFRQFYKAIHSGDAIENIQELLKVELNKGINLLISEEMIILPSEEKGWRDKIENLRKIIGAMDYHIIITVREPVNAMFSFFSHKYVTYKKDNKSFEEIATTDKNMEIYQYKKLFSFIHRKFDKTIKCRKFRKKINRF